MIFFWPERLHFFWSKRLHVFCFVPVGYVIFLPERLFIFFWPERLRNFFLAQEVV